MTREQAAKILEQFGGQFGHEYNEALDVLLHKTSPCDVCKYKPTVDSDWTPIICRKCPAARREHGHDQH